MKRTFGLLALGAAAALWASAAQASRVPGGLCKMHAPQLPDLSANGVDVDMSQNWLADDFRCTSTGPVTDVHLWCSWKNDAIADPSHVVFYLKLYSDLAATDPLNPYGYSMPLAECWSGTFDSDAFTSCLRQDGLTETFWDPILGTTSPDTECYQYNITVPELSAFNQTEGTTYWLAVMAVPLEGYTQIGWKSSPDHFQDDGVYWDATFGRWIDLHYPSGHPLNPQSVDLAFVITPEPATLSLLALGGLLLIRRRS